jgi:predicted nucleotidyltransferase
MATVTIRQTVSADVSHALGLFVGRMARIKKEIKSIVLYGSYARGDSRAESDVDVALIFRVPISGRSDLRRFLSTESFEVFWQTAVLISPVAIGHLDWDMPELHSNPYFIEGLKVDGIRIWGQS